MIPDGTLVGLGPERLAAWAATRGLRLLSQDGGEELGFQRPGRPTELVRWIPRPERSLCTLALQAPFLVAPTAVERVEHALVLANEGIHQGSWVLEPSGQLFFRMALPVRGVVYADATIDQLIANLLQVMDVQGARLLQVATGAPAEQVLTSA